MKKKEQPKKNIDYAPEFKLNKFIEPKNYQLYIKKSFLDGLNEFRFRSRLIEFKIDTVGYQKQI